MELDARVVADQEFAKGWTETARKLREYDQLLFDVRTLQAEVEARRFYMNGFGNEACKRAEKATDKSGALTRWRDDAKPL